MLGAKMMLEGKWMKPGVYNVEEFDPDPFLAELGSWGLPWHEAIDIPLAFDDYA
jgi:saccharopine dehydrogenase (NAD+, L-lysine forming)